MTDSYVFVFLNYIKIYLCLCVFLIKASFYGWDSTVLRQESHFEQEVYLFTTSFLEIPGTHFINFRRMKGLVDLRATQWLSELNG